MGGSLTDTNNGHRPTTDLTVLLRLLLPFAISPIKILLRLSPRDCRVGKWRLLDVV